MGGLGLRWQSRCVVGTTAAVAAVLTPGTKKSLSVTATERTWLTKPPCKCQKESKPPYKCKKESNVRVPAPQADSCYRQQCCGAGTCGEEEVTPRPSSRTRCGTRALLFGEPIHPSGIVIDIVGMEMSCLGRLCDEHKICSKVLEADVVVRLRKIQLMVEGNEEMVITAIWVTDRIDCCRIGFVPCHMVQHAARYDGALAQVTHVFSDNPEICDTTERRMFFKNKGYCRVAIISTLPGSTM